MASDEPVYKPRRTRGTPSYRYRNYFALGGCAVAVVLGLLMNELPKFKAIPAKLGKGEYITSAEEEERRELFNSTLFPLHSKQTILRGIKQEEDYQTMPIFVKDDGK